jgi:predicted enzyme related to lactoylglutathione lyase
MTVDPAAAGPFYTKVVGWKSEPWASEPTYTIFSGSAGPAAGMSPLPEVNRAQGARGAWMTFIGAEDVDAAVSQAEKLGAKVLRPASDMKEIGRIAIMADPHGASFGLFKPLQSSAPKGPPQPGELAWHELSTPDPEAALKFYQELFGWQLIHKMDMGATGFYYIFGSEGVQRGGMYKPSHPTPGPAWLAYASVPDADKAAAAATKAGGHVLNGPMDVPGGGRIAQLSDPHGVPFAVHSLAKAAVAPKPAAPKPSTPPASSAPPKPAPSAKPAAPASSSTASAMTAAPKPAAPKPAAPAAPAKSAAAAPKRKAAAKKKAAPKKKAAAKRKAAPRKAAARRGAPKPARKAAGKKKAARKAARKAAKKGKSRTAKRKARRGGKKARRKK